MAACADIDYPYIHTGHGETGPTGEVADNSRTDNTRLPTLVKIFEMTNIYERYVKESLSHISVSSGLNTRNHVLMSSNLNNVSDIRVI